MPCAADKNPGAVESGPFAYLFPLSAITVSEKQCGRGLVIRMQKEVTFQAGEAGLQTDQYNDFVASEDQMSPTRLHVPFRLEWKLEGSHPCGVALKSLAFPYFPLLLKRHKKWSESVRGRARPRPSCSGGDNKTSRAQKAMRLSGSQNE